jgi:hypothetical protein
VVILYFGLNIVFFTIFAISVAQNPFLFDINICLAQNGVLYVILEDSLLSRSLTTLSPGIERSVICYTQRTFVR